jgi:hypothetical protein
VGGTGKLCVETDDHAPNCLPKEWANLFSELYGFERRGSPIHPNFHCPDSLWAGVVIFEASHGGGSRVLDPCPGPCQVPGPSGEVAKWLGNGLQNRYTPVRIRSSPRKKTPGFQNEVLGFFLVSSQGTHPTAHRFILVFASVLSNDAARPPNGLRSRRSVHRQPSSRPRSFLSPKARPAFTRPKRPELPKIRLSVRPVRVERRVSCGEMAAFRKEFSFFVFPWVLLACARDD